jgi:DNA-binding Lrp family transcriptional regulator
MTYDDKDIRIISALRRDSYQRLADYTAATGVPRSTLHERLRKLQQGGVRCTPLLSWERLGAPIHACFFLPYNEELVQGPEVNNAFRLAPSNLFLECLFTSMKEAEEYREKLGSAARMFLVVDVVKREGFVPENP